MKITTVSFNKAYNIGPFLNERVGVEAIIEEGDNPIEVLQNLRELSDRFNEVNNPHRADQNTAPIINEPLPEIQVEKPIESKDQILSIEDDIRSFTNYDKLGKVYGMLAKVQPDIAAVYNEMREKLKAAEIKDILDRTEEYGKNLTKIQTKKPIT